MEAPEFFEARPTPDPEQYQEDEALQDLLTDLEPEVQEEGVPQDLQGDLEPEMEEEQEVLQAMQEGLEPEVEYQEILQVVQGEPGPEVEGEQDVSQAVQEGPEPDVKEQEGILQTLQGQIHLEINRVVHPEEVEQEYEAPVARIHLRQHIEPNIQQELVHLTDILQENEVDLNVVPMASDLRPSWEGARREILQQIMHLNIVPMASELLRPSWEGARREILQQIMHLNIVPMASELLRPSWEGARREILQQIMQLNIVPMASELLRPSWKEARSEILQQIMSFNTEQVRFRIANITEAMDITRQEFTTSFYSQEGPPRLLALEGPPRLLALESPLRFSALECPPLLSALECPSVLLALNVRLFLPVLDGRPLLRTLDGRSLLPSLVGRPLLPSLVGRPLLLASEVHASFSEETEMCSELQEKRDLAVQGPSERVSVCPCEPVEVLSVRPIKTKEHNAKKLQQRADPFDSGQPDATLAVSEVLQDVEHENQDVSDSGVPEISDPRELSKDLNFGEVKVAYLEMGHIGDLEMDPIGEIETEAGGDPEIECLPLFPPESQNLNEEIIEIPEEPDEVAPNAELPNNVGNCPDGEVDMESREMTIFVALLFLGLLLFLCIGNTLNVLSYELGWRDNRTENASTPVTDMVFNVTTPMNTTIFNVTSLDYNATTSMGDLSFNDTDMDI